MAPFSALAKAGIRKNHVNLNLCILLVLTGEVIPTELYIWKVDFSKIRNQWFVIFNLLDRRFSRPRMPARGEDLTVVYFFSTFFPISKCVCFPKQITTTINIIVLSHSCRLANFAQLNTSIINLITKVQSLINNITWYVRVHIKVYKWLQLAFFTKAKFTILESRYKRRENFK